MLKTTDHRAKEAQNNIVEEKRFRHNTSCMANPKVFKGYITREDPCDDILISTDKETLGDILGITPDKRISDEEFDKWYNEEFEEKKSEYIVSNELYGSQRHLAESAIKKIECLLDVGWVRRVDG